CGEGTSCLSEEEIGTVYKMEGLSTRFYNIPSFHSSFRKFRKQNFSVVHLLSEKERNRTLKAAAVIKKPALFTVYSPVTEDSSHLLKRPVKLILTFSEATRISLVNQGAIPKERIRVLLPVIDSSLFTPSSSRNEVPVIGFAADFEPYSGADILIKAVSRLISKGLSAHLLLVGSGKDEKRLRALVREKNITKSVTFLLPNLSYQKILPALDIYVLCAAKEGEHTSTLFAAMAASKPVVTNAVNAVPELVEENSTALLTTTNSPDELAEVLERLLKDSNLRNRIALQASERVREKFPFNRCVEALLSVYREVTGER
ncbi:MAG: glycosyltransferase family 4 protein, partial [Planctomycetota bacterium]|nr:glycosyltransferase family 4 protein [Planctomycetota bacterium]